MEKTILFIEDEAPLQKTFADVLARENYKVVPALDGETGLRLAKDQHPDLILLDLRLPGIDGIEVLQRLKEGEETKAIPVIVLTNVEDMKEIEKVIDLGATIYLVKINYKLEEVVSKIKKALEE